MNYEESASYNEEMASREKKRRGVMLSIILCGVFIALLFILIIIISYQDSITEKFFVDGIQTSKLTNKVYKDISGVTYIDIKTVAGLLGYSYTKGEYKKYNENEDSCYLQNDFEIIALKAGNDTYDKYIELSDKATIAGIEVTSKNGNDYEESYKLEAPIIYENEKIYVPLTSLPKMLNINIDWQEYRKKIYTLENIVQNAQALVTKAGYKEISGYYENLRAIADGLVIVGDATEASGGKNNASKYYGVYSLANGGEIVSKKYDDITYIQNVGEFYITVENGTMGLLNGEGGTIIAPSEFEKISLLDEKNQLYLVQKGQEYGVIGRKGQVLIHSDYDKIGLDEDDCKEFSLEPIENLNLIYDNCIPVEKNGSVGLFNKNGDELQQTTWQGFGYKSTATSKTSGNEQSVLLIPPTLGVKGIVVNFNDLYGIFDVTEERLILPCVYDKIYAITKNGKTTYYAEWAGGTLDLEEYFEDEGLKNVNEDGTLLEKSKKSNKDDETEKNKDNDNDTTNTIVDGNQSDEVIVIE